MEVPSFTDSLVTYRVDEGQNTCTCLKWRYQRLPVRQRTCKHLDSVRGQLPPQVDSIVTYPPDTVKDTYFQLIAHKLPKVIEPHTYVYSIKYDGIRVRITGRLGITRGGLRIDLSRMSLPFETTEVEYDAELIHLHKSGHNHVMLELSANRLENLSIRVFDVIDTTLSFSERQQYLKENLERPFRVQYHPVDDRAHLEVVTREILQTEEGLVVRRLSGKYEQGRRRRHNAFKVKRPIGLLKTPIRRTKI